MLDDEYNLFKKLVPKSLHGMYDELKQKLEVSLTANESVMTFEQFINKI